MQDLNINQLKLVLHDSYGKQEKLSTKFEPTDEKDVINKAYLDQKLSKIDGHLSLLEKDYNEFKTLSDKQSIEEVLVQRALKTTIQILYGKVIFDNFPIADEVLQHFLFVTRRTCYLEES